jgi:hypothetical protein
MVSILMRRALSGAGRRRAAAVALCAAACGLAAACSPGTPSASHSSSTSPSASPTPETPQQALTLAAADTQKVNSLAGNVSTQNGGSTPTADTSTFQVRMQPSPLLGLNITVTSNGSQLESLSEVLSSTADYQTVASGLSAIYGGKTWTEIPLSEATGGPSTMGWDDQDADMSSPVAQAQLLATSSAVTEAGTQVVNGAKTTEYTGTVSVSAALSALPPSLSNALGEPLHYVSDISFTIWIDSQHIVRKITENYTSQGTSSTSTINVTSVNQAVTVAVPPASEVYVFPASAINQPGG